MSFSLVQTEGGLALRAGSSLIADRELREPKGYPPLIVCSWCDVAHEQTHALEAQGYKVSHGICRVHAAQWRADAQKGARG